MLSKFRTILNTAGHYFAFVVLGMRLGSLGPTLPRLVENTSSTFSAISLIFFAHGTGYILGSILGGRIYNNYPGNRVMSIMLIVMAFITIMIPFISYLWFLGILFLGLGIVESIVDVGGNTLCLWLHRVRSGKYLSGLYCFLACGALLSPVIVAWSIQISNDIKIAYSAFSFLMVLPAIILYFAPSPIPSLEANEPIKYEHETYHYKSIVTILLSLFIFLHVGASVGFDAWIFSYAYESGIVNETTAAYLTSLFWGVLVIGRLFMVPIISRVKSSHLLFVSLTIGILSLTEILLFPKSITFLIFGICGFGLAIAPLTPTSFSLAENIWRPRTIPSAVTGWFIVGSSGGAIVVPWIIGQYFSSIGPIVTVIILNITLIFAILTFGILIKTIQIEKTKQIQ